MPEPEIPKVLHEEDCTMPPFCRKKTENGEEADRFAKEVSASLTTLGCDVTSLDIPSEAHGIYDKESEYSSPQWIKKSIDLFSKKWKLKDEMSEVAFNAMLLILEHCLSHDITNTNVFRDFVQALGYHTVFFWKKAVPLIYDSDMQFGTNYRDGLLFSLALFDVNEGHNRLRELFAAVPGLRDSLLGKHAKRFEEAFHSMLQRRLSFSMGSTSGRASEVDSNEINEDNEMSDEECNHSPNNHSCNGEMVNGFSRMISVPETAEEPGLEEELSPDILADEVNVEIRKNNMSPFRKISINLDADSVSDMRSVTSGDMGSMGHSDTIMSSGLSSKHFQQRVINVSNAPPVSLRQRADSGTWELGQGSGGLVSCCDPVMNKDPSNMWLACFGPSVRFGSRSDISLRKATNSLGIPIIKTAENEMLNNLNVLAAPKMREGEQADEVRDQMSLLGVLRDHNRHNYKLNPVLVQEEDYQTYYGGISNGLLWPALHNLPEYIVKDYDDIKVLLEHWHAYVRVNYQFAINAVRNSRPQDFLWIHDYHLLLTGMIVQSLDPHLEVGFFLHIPFQPPEQFFTKYGKVGVATLRGILRFSKVGFQTVTDRQKFVDLVRKYLTSARIKYDNQVDNYTVVHEGWTASLGVFPVSIKNEEFLDLANDPQIQTEAREMRDEYKDTCRGDDGKLFFSVERFDYTKGIKEKLAGYRRFLEKYPERRGKDVFLQIAVTNRRSVETYRQYQDDCIEAAEKINTDFSMPQLPDWKPLIFQTEGLARPKLVAAYLAMDVGVVTPKRDGMNLVAKEMIVCNPKCSLVISCGAGTEQQLNAAGFYTEEKKCYHRLTDVYDVEKYADVFYEAAIEQFNVTEDHTAQIRGFLMANDIEKWSSAFLDPSWTHSVIRETQINTLHDFYSLMFATRNVRRQIAERVLKGIPIKPHFMVSLQNAKSTLEKQCLTDTTTIVLQATETPGESKQAARLDIKDEIQELGKDMAFLECVQSEDFDNVEQFLKHMEQYHPVSPEAFHNEVEQVITLISNGDHFMYIFTDRDGTLKSYSCSYPSSIQPAYGAVIQATFAHRCSQHAVMITSAPLLNIGILDVRTMPDGYYSYGASGGREWYIDASKKFKDSSIADKDLELMDVLADRISDLLEQSKFQHFTWVGSGLQKHYGHITVAKQDPFGSVDVRDSRELYAAIMGIVNQVDPQGKTLRVADTETDIKIHLKAKISGKIFNKGSGIALFGQKMGLDFTLGNILVCGDSDSDIPMLDECLRRNPANTYTVWVLHTTSSANHNQQLQQKVIDMCGAVNNKNYAFVSCPEAILGAMAQATIREIRVRPMEKDHD